MTTILYVPEKMRPDDFHQKPLLALIIEMERRHLLSD
jgi:hypothetical protein